MNAGLRLPLLCRSLAPVLLLLAAGVGTAAAEIVVLRDGRVMEGEILDVNDEKVSLRIGGADTAIPIALVSPEHVYRLRSKRLDAKDAKGHAALGAYCLENGLYTQGMKLWEKAVELDPTLREAAQKQIAAATEKDASDLLETGSAFAKDGKYDEALKKLQVLLDRYPQSAQATEAKKVMTDAAEAIRKKNEEREKALAALEKKKADDKAAKGEESYKAKLDLATKLIEDGRRLNVEGLDHEGNTKVTRAHQAWERAAGKFAEARALLGEVQAQSKDADLQAAAKEKVADVDRWLVVVYDNLGHLWAMELAFRDAIKWLNKALAIDPHDKFASELKLKLAEQQIQRRLGPGIPPGVVPGGDGR